LAADPDEILKFAFQLRKLDTEDKYSYHLLNEQLRPPILVDIIMANKWNDKEGTMTIKEEDRYAFMCGEKYLRYKLKGKEQRQSLQLSELKEENGYDSQFYLLLTENGLMVKSEKRSLIVQQHGMSDNGQFQLMQAATEEQQHTLWNLIPIDYRGEEPIFCVEVPDGEKRPRIVSSSSGVGVMVSTRDQDGYFEQTLTAWKLVKTNEASAQE
jgi:hypothetical protein